MNRKEFTIIALITLTTVIVWIVLGIYHARNSTMISETQKKEIIPSTPTFDSDIIRELQEREE